MARPLVAGEDPGRLQNPEATSGQILNLLWLVVAAAAAVWMARAPRPLRLGGPVAVGLMAVALLVLLSAVVGAGYRHPAWLIACEWAVLPVVFVLARELTADADPATDSAGGILSAILASGVSLAAYSLYQALGAVARIGPTDLPVDAGTPAPPADDFAALWPKSVSIDWVTRATLERSDTFAALLLLLLPAVVVCGWRSRARVRQLALAAAGVMLVALLLAGRDFVTRDYPALVRDGWTTAGRMVWERPGLGVGPGNFDRHAPHLQPIARTDLLTDAWGSYHELAATCGVPALAAFLALVGFTFWKLRARVPDEPPSEAPAAAGGLPRWEFYLGGVVGLLLGLGLRVKDLPGAAPSQMILTAGAGAVGRALVWFLAFALFEGCRTFGTVRRRSLLVGLALVLLAGLVSGAALRPAVMQPFWLVAGLALGGGTAAVVEERAGWALRWVPAAALLTAVVAYLALVVEPAVGAASASYRAHVAAVEYRDRYYYDAVVAPPRSIFEQEERLARAANYLGRLILAPLRAAAKADPADAGRHLEVAAWNQSAWRLSPARHAGESVEPALVAARLDPHSAAPPLRQFLMHATFASVHPSWFKNPTPEQADNIRRLRTSQFDQAEALIPAVLARDQALEARLRFRLAQAMIAARTDPDKPSDFHKRGLEVAAAAWQLHEAAPGPRWRLTPEQSTQVRKWLNLPAE